MLHDLGHEIPHGFCCLILDLTSGVSVGAEGEACIVVTQHAADGFHVYAVLEGYCGEGVPEAMERNVIQIGILENLLMELCYGVRMVHFSGGWRREHVLVIGVLIVFLDQEVYRRYTEPTRTCILYSFLLLYFYIVISKIDIIACKKLLRGEISP